MSSELNRFANWAARARREVAPQPDVTAAVLRRLGGERARSQRPPVALWIFSGASAAAAMVCGLLGYAAWMELTAPLYPLVQELPDWWTL